MQISFAAPAATVQAGKLGGGGVGGRAAVCRRRSRPTRRAAARLSRGAESLPLHRQSRADFWRCWRRPACRPRASCWSGWASPRRWMKRRWRRDRRPDRGPAVNARAKRRPPSRSKCPKAAKVKSGEAGGASGLRRAAAQLRFRQIPHQESRRISRSSLTTADASRPPTWRRRRRPMPGWTRWRTASSWPAIWSTSRRMFFIRRNSRAAPRRSPSWA